MSLREQLQEGEKIIGIWGLGYIGFSSMAFFARAGIRCIGTDPINEKVDDVNRGKSAIPNMDYWLGFDVAPLAKSGLTSATTNWKDLISDKVAVHLICVPTEKGGEPYENILIEVIERICEYRKLKMQDSPLLIIESTLTPDTIERIVIPVMKRHGVVVGKDLLLGVAPRRDWFVSPEKNLKTLPRVVGGTTPETTDLMADVLGIVCDTVYKATDHKHAAMVKSIENAYRHVEISLANQLSLAYPDVNMTEVLRLVGTKWNIGTYHPSFGTGGYCIPLSSRYVLRGAKNPEILTIFKSAIESDDMQPMRVVDSLIKRGVKNIGVLGLAYKGDLKVEILSPAIKIVKRAKEKGIPVKVSDPYYTKDEIQKICDVDSFNFPDDLGEFDAIVIVADHMLYKATPQNKIVSRLNKCSIILDNVGIWKDLRFPKTMKYYEAGSADWMK